MWSFPKHSGTDPGPRAAHTCNVVDGKLFIFGGWNGKKALNDLHVCSLETMKWQKYNTSGAIPTARNNHTSTRVGTRLFIHGGHGGSSWLDDLHILDTKRKIWSKPDIPPLTPPARACHTLTKVETKLYMFGGYDGAKCFNTLEVLDLDTLAWMRPRCAGVWPESRNAHSMTAVGHNLYLFGGHSGNRHLRDMHVLNIDNMSWSQPEIKGSVPPGLRGHSANLVGKQIFIFGGYDGRLRSNEMYVLETECNSPDEAATPGGSSGYSAAAPGEQKSEDSIHQSEQNPASADDTMDIASESSPDTKGDTIIVRWKQVSSDTITPVGRQRHTACVYGTQKVYIFGGFDGHKWLNDLHVLDAGKFEKTLLIDRSISKLLINLRLLLNNECMFSDIRFLVEDRAIYAHKAILAVQCDHFNAMFGSGMKESTAEEIVIPGWEYAPFLCLLEFLYTGTVAEFSLTIAVALLPLADHYTLDRLRLLCESVLVHNVDQDNVCTLFVSAHRSGALELKKRCLSFILNNFEGVSSTASFNQLSEEPSLLVEVARASLFKQGSGKHS